MIFLWFILLGVASFLAWFCLNSRQWLLAWIWLPASLAALAWYLAPSGFWIAVYFLSLCTMMLPASGVFILLADWFLYNKFNHLILKSWETWDIKEMWRNPTPMRSRK